MIFCIIYLIRNVLLDLSVLMVANYQSLVNQVTIAMVQDKQNVSSAQKDSNVRTLHLNQHLVQRVTIVRRVMQHVWYVQKVMNVPMVHHPGCVLRDSMHLLVPQHARHVLQVINVLIKECQLLRLVQMGNTQTKHYKWHVIHVKLVVSVQMVIDLYHVRLVTLVSMDSQIAWRVSQETTVKVDHLYVCHVQLENSVWIQLLNLWTALLVLFLVREKVFVSSVHKVGVAC